MCIRDSYNIEIVLNVPLDEFEEFKRHAASAGRGKNQKNKSQNPQKVGRCTSNAGIVCLLYTSIRNIFVEVSSNQFHPLALHTPLVDFTGVDQLTACLLYTSRCV